MRLTLFVCFGVVSSLGWGFEEGNRTCEEFPMIFSGEKEKSVSKSYDTLCGRDELLRKEREEAQLAEEARLAKAGKVRSKRDAFGALESATSNVVRILNLDRLYTIVKKWFGRSRNDRSPRHRRDVIYSKEEKEKKAQLYSLIMKVESYLKEEYKPHRGLNIEQMKHADIRKVECTGNRIVLQLCQTSTSPEVKEEIPEESRDSQLDLSHAHFMSFLLVAFGFCAACILCCTCVSIGQCLQTRSQKRKARMERSYQRVPESNSVPNVSYLV